MEVKQLQENGIEIVELFGRFDELAGAEVRQVFDQIVTAGGNRVLVDMAGVEYISSSGLRTLLMLHRGLKANQGVMKVCALSPFVAEVFEISNFTAVFDIHATRKEGLEAFQTQRK